MTAENSKPYCAKHRPVIMYGPSDLRFLSGHMPNVLSTTLDAGGTVGPYSHEVIKYGEGLVHRVTRVAPEYKPAHNPKGLGQYDLIAWMGRDGTVKHVHLAMQSLFRASSIPVLNQVIYGLAREKKADEVVSLGYNLRYQLPSLRYETDGLLRLESPFEDNIPLIVDGEKIIINGKVYRNDPEAGHPLKVPIYAGWLENHTVQFRLNAGVQLVALDRDELNAQLNSAVMAFLQNPMSDQPIRKVMDPFLDIEIINQTARR